MKADEYTFTKLLHSNDQYVIPLFQRYYAWERNDWQRLWDDVNDLLEPDAPAEHFMGSLVCMQGDHLPGKVAQYLVIDGQQRLITSAILLCALRDEARKQDLAKLADQINNNFLVHAYEDGLDHYKILPRLRDRQSIFDLVDASTSRGDDRVYQAYTFFRERLVEAVAKHNPEHLRRLLGLISGSLSMVMITLKDENPYAIFETLNSTGQPLDEADLIRNYVFLRVPLDKQDAFDEGSWRPFEDGLAAADGVPAIPLKDFFRDFLMRGGKYVRQNGVYIAFQQFVEQEQLTPGQLTGILARAAENYRWIQRPSTAPDKGLRRELTRIRRLGVSTAYPLVLHLLDRYEHGDLSLDELIGCLRVLQSFVIRRSIVGETTRPYSHFFPSVARDLPATGVLKSLAAQFAKRGWPDDERFTAALVEFALYRRELVTARLLLLALEEAEGHKEALDVDAMLGQNKLQIEHVMPQAVGDDAHGQAWQDMLGQDWRAAHDALVDTLGNLTLTGYNPSLSNKPYEEKCEEYDRSHLELNRYFATQAIWDASAIRARGKELAADIAAIWPAASAHA